MIKVMIADDQELIRQSLQIVLEMKEESKLLQLPRTEEKSFRKSGKTSQMLF